MLTPVVLHPQNLNRPTLRNPALNNVAMSLVNGRKIKKTFDRYKVDHYNPPEGAYDFTSATVFFFLYTFVLTQMTTPTTLERPPTDRDVVSRGSTPERQPWTQTLTGERTPSIGTLSIGRAISLT